MKKNLNYHKKKTLVKIQGSYFLSKKLLIAGFIIARIIDAIKAVPNELILAPLAKLKVISKTIAFTINENKPKVMIVNGRDNNFKIGFIIALTNINNKAVIIISLFCEKVIPSNKMSRI